MDQQRSSQIATAAVVAVIALAVVVVTLVRQDGSGPTAGPEGTPPATTPTTTEASPTPGTEPPRATRTPEVIEPPRRGRPVCVRTREDVTLTVVSYNIKSGRLSGDLSRIATVLLESRADVVLLQEVDRGTSRVRGIDEPTWFAEQLDMYAAFGANLTFGGGSYGTAVLSRYPISAPVNVPLPNAPGGEQRGLLRAVIDVGGVEVSLYNTHLEAGRRNGALRLRQVRRVQQVVAGDANPSILGGDLNAGPGAAEIGVVRSFLVDTWQAVGSGSGNTVPASAPRNRIDYLMHSAEGITPLAAQVLPARLSDHLAIRAVYRVEGTDERICVPLPPLPPG